MGTPDVAATLTGLGATLADLVKQARAALNDDEAQRAVVDEFDRLGQPMPERYTDVQKTGTRDELNDRLEEGDRGFYVQSVAMWLTAGCPSLVDAEGEQEAEVEDVNRRCQEELARVGTEAAAEAVRAFTRFARRDATEVFSIRDLHRWAAFAARRVARRHLRSTTRSHGRAYERHDRGRQRTPRAAGRRRAVAHGSSGRPGRPGRPDDPEQHVAAGRASRCCR